MSDIADENPNAHIVQYLEYYCNPENDFDFAVMVKGAWGSGKTYFIERFRNDREGRFPSQKILYVTLNGVSSTDQIDDQLFTQLHPVLGSKEAKVLGAIAKNILKASFRVDFDSAKDLITLSPGVPDIKLSKYTVRPSETVIIFDDLERCIISIPAVLGYINTFLEHEKLKVIILSNEDEVLKNDKEGKYREIKEKLIGKTLRILPHSSEAIKEFVAKITNEKTRRFFESKLDTIAALYKESATDNLRILGQSLAEADRAACCLADRHWEHEDVVKSIVALILVISFEIRAARVSEDDIRGLKQQSRAYSLRLSANTPTVLDKLKERYPEINSDSLYLEGPTVRQILFDGMVDQGKIHAEIDSNPPFVKVDIEPAWKRIAGFWRVTEDEFEKAVTEFEQEFNRRKFVDPGPMFQAFGVRLLLSEMGVIAGNASDVVIECKRYIDDMKNTGCIKNKYTGKAEIDRSMGWGGLVFVQNDSKEFTEINDHYRAVIDEVAKAALPAEGQRLLAMMKTDHVKFFRTLCVNNFEASIYYNVPVLASIDPTAFADAVLTLTPEAQSSVFTALRVRYDTTIAQDELADEKSWLAEVKRAFDARLGSLKPLSRFRLKNLVGRNVTPFV